MSVYGGPYADGKKKRTFVGRNGKVQRGNFGNTYKFNNKPNGLKVSVHRFYRIAFHCWAHSPLPVIFFFKSTGPNTMT